jgi:hypothetical protein
LKQGRSINFLFTEQIKQSTVKMVKFAALTTAVLVGSTSAFAPAGSLSRNAMALNAEKSQALPFMNRPALVSTR